MKIKRFSIISMLIITVLSVSMLTGCDEESSKGNFPSNKSTVISSKNSSRKSYDINVEEFTEKFNEMYEDKTNSGGVALDSKDKPTGLSQENFTPVGDKNTKNGETTCTSYHHPTEKCEIILTVDDSTEKVISFAVATTGEVWKESARDVETVAVIGSVVCGGYEIEDFDFFKKLYESAISGNCFYDDILYKTSGTEKDNSTVIKLMSLPCSKDSISKTSYTDYKKYIKKECKFGEH
ncbi:MAG: hypothetical protein ACI4HM_10665 [Ruminococcus sp.]